MDENSNNNNQSNTLNSQLYNDYCHHRASDLKILIERPIYYSNEFLTDKTRDGTLKKHRSNTQTPPNNDQKDGQKAAQSGPDYSCSADRQLGSVIKHKLNSFLINGYHNFDLTSSILYLFPIVSWLPKSFAGKDLLADLIAGFTVLALQIPQGLAYARLAGVEPVYGLSVSLFAPVLYAFFGKSRHISIGTYAVVSIVCKDVLERMQNLHDLVDTDKDPVNGTSYLAGAFEQVEGLGDPNIRPIDILVSLTLLVGVIQLFMACFRLGVLASLLSDNIISAFCAASAFHAITSQCYGALGISSEDVENELEVNSEVIRSWYRIIVRIPESNLPTLIMSVLTLAVLIGCKYYLEPWILRRFKKSITIPIELLVVIVLTAIAYLFDLEEKHDMEMIPKIEFTFDALPYRPRVDLWPKMIPEAIMMTFITYVGMFSLAKIYADKNDYSVDANQELYALGMTNALSAFLFCFPSSASLARSTVQDKVGGKTQLASLISSGMMLVFILYLSSYLETLPKCALSTIIIVALLNALLKCSDALYYWRQSPADGIMWVLTFALVTFVGVDIGLIIALLVSIGLLLYRLAFPSLRIKGQFLNSEHYVSLSDYEKTCYQECANLVIFDFSGPLFYLNVQTFKSHFGRSVLAKIAKSPHIKAVVFDCSSLTYIDEAGVKMLTEIQKELANVRLLLASASPGIVRQLVAFQFKSKQDDLRVFLSVHDAVCSEM